MINNIKYIIKFILNVIIMIIALPFLLVGCVGLIILHFSDYFDDEDHDIHTHGPYKGWPKL